MDEHAIRRALEGGGGTPGSFFRALLWLPGVAYGCCMRLRRTAYRQGVFASGKVDVPVISIGNLSAGGTGKTPFVALLAAELAQAGRKPGILLRGYRQTQAGISDEAELYRRLCPDSMLEVGSDRLLSAKRAMEKGADVLLMDDGFQHLRLRRNVDIVLIDATSPWAGGNCIPGGLLREPVSTLRQADVVVVTRSEQVPRSAVEKIQQRLCALAPGALITTARHKACRLFDLNGKQFPLELLRGKRVLALSAIARPESFHATLEGLGAVLVGTVAGRDHGEFDPLLLESTLQRARSEGATLVMTEKDHAKQIFGDSADNSDVWVLGVEQAVDDWAELFARIWTGAGL